MIRKIIWGIMVSSLLISSSNAQTQPPKPFGPVPTENQLKLQEMEYYSFLHFSLNTFTGQDGEISNTPADAESIVHYTIDGSVSNLKSIKYTGTFQNDGKADVQAIARDSASGKS